MGAADDPTGDTQASHKGGPSMAVLLGTMTGRVGRLDYTWSASRAALGAGAMVPLASAPPGISVTGIPDPPHTVPADPDYTAVCAPSGTDDSARCLTAILQAIDNARSTEGVKPMTLPADFARLSISAQLLVAVNEERVDRGLPPFEGLSASLDVNASQGARRSNDPPSPGGVIGDDEEWAGGSVNGLDADYGWMYDDGRGDVDGDHHGRHGLAPSVLRGRLVAGAHRSATRRVRFPIAGLVRMPDLPGSGLTGRGCGGGRPDHR
jgi:hypothetical protein